MAAMTPEGKVKKWLDGRLDDLMPGHWRCKPKGGAFGKAGTGDYIICWHGVFIMIEVKADETCKPTDLQLFQLKCVQEAGGIAAVIKGRNETRLQSIVQMVLDKSGRMN